MVNIHVVCKWMEKSVTLIFICGCFSFISLKYSFTSDVERSVKFSLKFPSEAPCVWKNSNTNNLRCFCINVMYSSITYRKYSGVCVKITFGRLVTLLSSHFYFISIQECVFGLHI